MAKMLGSNANRVRLDVDNPIDGDGFYAHRRFKTRVNGLKGGRPARRVLRVREKAAFLREIRLTY